MSLLARTNNVIDIFEQFRHTLKVQDDYAHEKELADMIQMLDSPLFKQIVTVQDSLQDLGEKIRQTDHVECDDFDFTATGDLSWFQEGSIQGSYQDDHDGPWDHDVAVSSSTDPGLYDSIFKDDPEFVMGMMSAGQGRQIFTIKLEKPDVGGLGFSVIGLKSETRGELGIFVQTLQPGGVAELDGRLSESDQILAINGQRVDTVMSHQEAINLLQHTTGIVELVVARGGIPNNKNQLTPQDSVNSSTVSDTSINQEEPSHWRQEETIHLVNDGTGLGFGIVGGKNASVIVRSIVNGGVADRDGRLKSGDHILQINDENLFGMTSDQVASIIRRAGDKVKLVISRDIVSEEPNNQIPIPVAKFQVQLRKNARGLGITIYGVAGDQDNPSGIYIQKIAEGSAAAQDGRLKPDDQIVEVDGQSLQGMNNHEAINLLRNTGSVVSLVVARIMDEEHQPHLSKQIGLSEEDLLLAVKNDELYDYPLELYEEEEIKQKYVQILGAEVDVEVAQFSKFYNGSLGISVEGSTERQEGIFMSHRVYSVSPDGPVGRTGKIFSGDYLIEVNGVNVLELTHPEVVKLIKTLPRNIRLIVARNKEKSHVVPMDADVLDHTGYTSMHHQQESVEKPDLQEAPIEPPSNLVYVKLEKKDKGLGFSILDTQDPQDPNRSIIVIKSIVNGGPAEETGSLHSGDELVSVNRVTFDNVALEMAVQALKSTPKGPVLIGVRKNRIPDDTTSEKPAEPVSPTPPAIVTADIVSEGSKPFIAEPTKVQGPDGSFTIRIKKDVVGLGISLGNDTDGYGFPVKGIIESGTVKREGSIQINDRITKIGNDALENVTIQQARAILRKAAMQDEVVITFIPASVIEKKIKEDAALRPAQLSTFSLSNQSNSSDQLVSPMPSYSLSERRVVDIIRHPEFGLGISIVGGRQEDNEKLQGIFIKHVLESSPAGQTGLLKTGDQILEVGGVDISTASHEEAVTAIRNAKSPVRFVVRSLTVRQQGDLTQNLNLPQAPVLSVEEQQKTETLEKYKDFDGDVFLVVLEKGNTGIGLSIVGGKGNHIYVIDVKLGGPADLDGRIRSGDELLEVNDVRVQGFSHKDASAILRKAEGSAKLVVGRPRNPASFETNLQLQGSTANLDASNKKELKKMKTVLQEQLITLNKGHAGLGFAIGEGQRSQDGETGIFIRNVTEGGTAYKDGQLRIGDQLLSINSQSLNGLHQADAVSIIRSSEGQVVLNVCREIEVPVESDEEEEEEVKQQGGELKQEENKDEEEQSLPIVVPLQQPQVDHTPPLAIPEHASPPPPFEGDAAQIVHVKQEAPISPTPIRVLDPVDELEESSAKNPIIMENPTSIQIVKGNQGLGISLVGGNDTPLQYVIVDEIYHDGASYKDGRLWSGDKILKVNDYDMRLATHDMAVKALSLAGPEIRLVVLRDGLKKDTSKIS